MPGRQQTSRIAALLGGRKRAQPSGGQCPACGDPLTVADHAVFLGGSAYHAGCVLYQRRLRPGSR